MNVGKGFNPNRPTPLPCSLPLAACKASAPHSLARSGIFICPRSAQKVSSRCIGIRCWGRIGASRLGMAWSGEARHVAARQANWDCGRTPAVPLLFTKRMIISVPLTQRRTRRPQLAWSRRWGTPAEPSRCGQTGRSWGPNPQARGRPAQRGIRGGQLLAMLWITWGISGIIRSSRGAFFIGITLRHPFYGEILRRPRRGWSSTDS